MLKDIQLTFDLFSCADGSLPACAPRFHISDVGIVVGPEGVCRQLSKVLSEAIASMPVETRKKMLPRWVEFLNMELDEEEDWRSIWLEGEERSIERQQKFLIARGHSFGPKRSLDGSQQLKHPNPTYGNFDRLALHRLYDLLELSGLAECNHTLLAFFANADLQSRLEYIKLLSKRGHRSDHIGRRWLAPKISASVSIPVDPAACVALLADDLERIDAPDIIKDANTVLALNGKRPMSVIHASAYGWVIKGMGAACGCRNKQRGDDVTVASFAMPEDVRARLIARLRSEPSAIRPNQSVLDDVTQAAEMLRSEVPAEVEEARCFLRRVAIFPRPSAASSIDAFMSYGGLIYWTLRGRAARRSAGFRKPLQFSDGRREPTLRDYRRASITADVLELFARTRKGSDARREGLLEIAARHDQSTDQSRAYAKWAYALEHEAEMLEQADANKKRMAEHRSLIAAHLDHPSDIKKELDHLGMRDARIAR